MLFGQFKISKLHLDLTKVPNLISFSVYGRKEICSKTEDKPGAMSMIEQDCRKRRNGLCGSHGVRFQ